MRDHRPGDDLYANASDRRKAVTRNERAMLRPGGSDR